MTTPMSAERFSDRFRFYCDQPQQQRGVLQLFEAISSTERGEEILCEQAPWALTYSGQPPAAVQPSVPAGGLDPRGSEEAGMAGPQKPAPVCTATIKQRDRSGLFGVVVHAVHHLGKPRLRKI